MSDMSPRRGRLLAASSLLALIIAGPALATPFTIGAGVTDTTAKTVTGTDAGSVAATGSLSTSGTAITWSGPSASPGVTITNDGTISSSGSRGIDTSGSSTSRYFTLNNNVGALLSGSNDGFRINSDIGSSAVVVINAGTIQSTSSGQAIDFDAIASTTGSVTINNLATGVIQSAGADAVRPGQGGVVNNAGQIISNSPSPDSSNDGVDFQGHSGTVNNLTGGSISGARHGITTDVDVAVTNQAGASITGRNGSGVGSDGIGTVTNFGTITGAVDGVSAAGDGDGVDIDGFATIVNWGVIQGTGAVGSKDGSPNASEGIAAGGGSITNHAGATISGAHSGILVDDGNAGSGVAATTLINGGIIQGLNGYGVKLVGNFDDTITNSGTISAVGGAAIDMGAGNDTLALQTGSSIGGLSDGGAGQDTIRLTGTGTLTNVVNFEKLSAESGAWTLKGTQSYATGVTVTDGAKLLLNGGVLETGSLEVGKTGAFGAAAGDIVRLTGDLKNQSQQKTDWNTAAARLEFVGADGTVHMLSLTGADLGATKQGLVDNFAWAALLIDLGNDLSLEAGIDGVLDLALYVGELLGAEIADGAIANIIGNGFNIYYDPGLAGNAYLAGLTYRLQNGGELIAMTDVPEPAGMLSLLVGLGALAFRRRRG